MAFILTAALAAACSSAVQGPRQFPEEARGTFAFDILLPEASARARLKGTYVVLADTVLLDLEDGGPCLPVPPFPPRVAEQSIRYDCGEVADSHLRFSFDRRRPHTAAWATVSWAVTMLERECVEWDRAGRCVDWRMLRDMPGSERIRLNARRVN